MSDKKIQFRKSMSGYNREDVNSYIESMSLKHYEAEHEYRKKITDLENKIKELEEQAKAWGENQAVELEELRTKAEESDNLIAKLNETVEKLTEEKEELVREGAQLKARVNECEKMSESTSDVYEKSSKYDQVSGQIGALILNANAKAETIVNEAQIKARVNTTAMIDGAVDRLQQINEKYISDITSKTVQLTEELRSLCISADSFRADTQTALENERLQLKESLEATRKIVLEGNDE